MNTRTQTASWKMKRCHRVRYGRRAAKFFNATLDGWMRWQRFVHLVPSIEMKFASSVSFAGSVAMRLVVVFDATANKIIIIHLSTWDGSEWNWKVANDHWMPTSDWCISRGERCTEGRKKRRNVNLMATYFTLTERREEKEFNHFSTGDS